MARVRMTTHITGTRNGEEWPDVGTVVSLPDTEASDLIVAGYAEAADDDYPTADDGVRKAVKTTKGR